MANIIKIKRGLKENLPASSVATTGELRYALDTNELFIDNGTENKLIINSNSKVDKSSVPYQIYGTDSEGNQTTYDKESFGKVDDVLIGTQSIVVDKIATLGTMASENANEYTKSTGFADVAFSGDYEDLSNTPALSTVATSGKYEDLLEKPILSTVALTGKYEDLLNKPFIPTTKADIGLGNVDNTSDLDKPISTATQTALDGKVSKTGDVITGDLEFSEKGIYLESIGSSVSASKSRLNLGSPGNVYSYLTGNKNGAFGIYSESSGSRTGIACYPGENFFADAPTETVTLGRNTNVWSTAYIKKLSNGTVSSETSDLIGHLSDTNNPHGVTKDQVGLGNVDNTSDLDKPISTATQTALNNKQNKLTAGTNIAINNDTISAIDTKYTAGTDITISNNVVSNKYPEVFLTQEEYDVLANNNQIDPNTYYNTIDTSVPLNIDDIILILPSLNEGDFLKQGTLAFVEV